jgi:type IX secretion system PorP/SprF family membrane protein
MKKLVYILLAICSFINMATVFAQQDVMFTQYMFNGLTLNPAYAGSHEAISTNFIWRKQWLNIDGAPQSYAFSLHSPVGGNKIGLGLQLVNDKIGASKSFLGNASASYILPISENAKLSFGLSAGLEKLDYNFSDLQGIELDPNFSTSNNITGSKVNFGTGIYYHSKKTFIGVSLPRILENEYSSNNLTYGQRRHFFIYAGHIIDLHQNIKFKPNILVKMATNSKASVDLNANFLFIDKIWLGVSYRSFESLDIIAQYHISDQLSIGYAYDMTTNKLKNYSNGSHEFMLSYLFSFKRKAMLSPRYF